MLLTAFRPKKFVEYIVSPIKNLAETKCATLAAKKAPQTVLVRIWGAFTLVSTLSFRQCQPSVGYAARAALPPIPRARGVASSLGR